MDITYNKVDQTALPISQDRVSASEYNQIAASLMQIITSAGLTPDSQDNAQLLTALGPRIVETYSNGTSWYRVWSDGWCEQGGQVNRGNTDTVNLLVTMVDTNYSIFMFSKFGHVYAYQNGASTTTSFKFNTADDASDNNNGTFYWEVKGYKAS